MRKWHAIKQKKAISLKATKAANIRWARDRAERERLALAAPRLDWALRATVLVIDAAGKMKEVTIYQCDEWRDIRRKLKVLGFRPGEQWKPVPD